MARSRSGTARGRARRSGPHRLWENRRGVSIRSGDAGRDCQQPHGSCFLDSSRVLMRAAHSAALDSSRLLESIDRFTKLRIAVFGDLIVDEFIYGDIARVSREAPVLILNYDSTEIVPGGAGNAANNVATLGGAARIAGLIGRDQAGRRLLETLKARRVDGRHVFRPAGYVTPRKTRILAGGVHSAKQQVVRIDSGAKGAVDEGMRRA